MDSQANFPLLPTYSFKYRLFATDLKEEFDCLQGLTKQRNPFMLIAYG
jgi:hypothetical protein